MVSTNCVQKQGPTNFCDSWGPLLIPFNMRMKVKIEYYVNINFIIH